MGVSVTNPLPENSSEPVEERASTTVVGLLAAGGLEPLEQFPLLRRKACRHHHVDDDLDVPAPTPPQSRHTLSPERERRTWFGAGIYPHLFRPFQGSCILLSPELHIHEADLHAVDQILPVAYARRIFFEADAHVELNWRRARIP